ncbi:MAG: hypothetical protein ACFFDI_10615 [Promethearchaeota archaeon]
MDIDTLRDFLSELSYKITRFKDLVQDEIIPEIDIRMAEILDILSVMPERIFDLRDYVRYEIIPTIEIFWVELKEYLIELPGSLSEFQRHVTDNLLPYFDTIIRDTRIFFLELHSQIDMLSEISREESLKIGRFIHENVRDFVSVLPASVLYIKESIYEMIEEYGTQERVIYFQKALDTWVEDSKPVFKTLFIRTKQFILEIPAFFYRLREFIYLGGVQARKLLLENVGEPIGDSDRSMAEMASRTSVSRSSSIPSPSLTPSNKYVPIIDKLNRMLEQALELDEARILRVFRGFLVFCRAKNQCFVLWIHEQNILGLLSQTTVVDTALLGTLLFASRIVPGGTLAARFAAQKIFKLPSETKNRVFIPSLHIVEYGRYNVMKEKTLEKISDSLKAVKSTSDEPILDSVPEETTSQPRLVIPPRSVLSYDFIRFIDRLEPKKSKEPQIPSLLEKITLQIEKLTLTQAFAFQVESQDETQQFLDFLLKNGFEVRFINVEPYVIDDEEFDTINEQIIKEKELEEVI